MTADATSEPSRPGQIKWEVKSIKEMSAEATEKRKNAIVPNLPKLSQIRNFDEDLEMEQRSIAAKAMRNPFVPIGMLATVGALTYGLYAFRKRDSRLQQIMMRWRVAAQSFTILSLIGGFMFYASDSSRSQSLNRDELMEEARKKRFEEEKKRIEMEKQRMTDKIKQKV